LHTDPVGYGDVYLITTGGKIFTCIVFTCIVLAIGMGIISVPAGLMASALSNAREMEDALPPDDST